jgi:hypothetical protein
MRQARRDAAVGERLARVLAAAGGESNQERDNQGQGAAHAGSLALSPTLINRARRAI